MKYSKELTQKICDHLRAGNGRIQAAKKAGIASSTFFEWYNKYPEFSEAIKKASEVGEVVIKETCISVIMRAAVENEQWQAAAWILERRYPKEYGRRVEVEDKTPPAPPQMIVQVTRPEYAAELQKLIDGEYPRIKPQVINVVDEETADEVMKLLQPEQQPANVTNSEISTSRPEQKSPESGNLPPAPAPAQESQPTPAQPARPPQQFGTYVINNLRKTRF